MPHLRKTFGHLTMTRTHSAVENGAHSFGEEAKHNSRTFLTFHFIIRVQDARP